MQDSNDTALLQGLVDLAVTAIDIRQHLPHLSELIARNGDGSLRVLGEATIVPHLEHQILVGRAEKMLAQISEDGVGRLLELLGGDDAEKHIFVRLLRGDGGRRMAGGEERRFLMGDVLCLLHDARSGEAWLMGPSMLYVGGVSRPLKASTHQFPSLGDAEQYIGGHKLAAADGDISLSDLIALYARVPAYA